jgi:hypothetical protein
MGHVDFPKITGTFNNNFDARGKTAVVPAATKIVLPNMPTKPSSPPAKFTATIPFKTPFVNLALNALVWEYVGTASSSTGAYIMDAHSGGTTEVGQSTVLGKGCVATGQRSAMTATATFTSYLNPNRIQYVCSTRNGTANANGGVLIGSMNPNAAFPICNKVLYTNADIALLGAKSDANGAFSTGVMSFPWDPVFSGMKVYSQTYTADRAMGPLPIAVSNGVESWVPALPRQYARIYSYNNHTSATGSLGNGYAVVTRFD